jgi:hypothetical protein
MESDGVTHLWYRVIRRCPRLPSAATAHTTPRILEEGEAALLPLLVPACVRGCRINPWRPHWRRSKVGSKNRQLATRMRRDLLDLGVRSARHGHQRVCRGRFGERALRDSLVPERHVHAAPGRPVRVLRVGRARQYRRYARDLRAALRLPSAAHRGLHVRAPPRENALVHHRVLALVPWVGLEDAGRVKARARVSLEGSRLARAMRQFQERHLRCLPATCLTGRSSAWSRCWLNPSDARPGLRSRVIRSPQTDDIHLVPDDLAPTVPHCPLMPWLLAMKAPSRSPTRLR